MESGSQLSAEFRLFLEEETWLFSTHKTLSERLNRNYRDLMEAVQRASMTVKPEMEADALREASSRALSLLRATAAGLRSQQNFHDTLLLELPSVGKLVPERTPQPIERVTQEPTPHVDELRHHSLESAETRAGSPSRVRRSRRERSDTLGRERRQPSVHLALELRPPGASELDFGRGRPPTQTQHLDRLAHLREAWLESDSVDSAPTQHLDERLRHWREEWSEPGVVRGAHIAAPQLDDATASRSWQYPDGRNQSLADSEQLGAGGKVTSSKEPLKSKPPEPRHRAPPLHHVGDERHVRWNSQERSGPRHHADEQVHASHDECVEPESARRPPQPTHYVNDRSRHGHEALLDHHPNLTFGPVLAKHRVAREALGAHLEPDTIRLNTQPTQLLDSQDNVAERRRRWHELAQVELSRDATQESGRRVVPSFSQIGEQLRRFLISEVWCAWRQLYQTRTRMQSMAFQR